MWVASSSPIAGSFASASTVESARIASSASTVVSALRLLTVTETISSARRPSSVARAASWCERAAQRSMSGRLISSSFETSLASLIICLSVNGLVSPSWVIASTAGLSPMRKPNRAPGSRYGAFDIDSIPPATPISRSPARIAWSATPIVRIPEAQTLFTVSDGTSRGIPALICAWREGIWPCPACSTWPKITCWICSGATSERSRAASIALPPSSVASLEARAPPILPNGCARGGEDHCLGHRDLSSWGRLGPRRVSVNAR